MRRSSTCQTNPGESRRVRNSEETSSLSRTIKVSTETEEARRRARQRDTRERKRERGRERERGGKKSEASIDSLDARAWFQITRIESVAFGMPGSRLIHRASLLLCDIYKTPRGERRGLTLRSRSFVTDYKSSRLPLFLRRLSRQAIPRRAPNTFHAFLFLSWTGRFRYDSVSIVFFDIWTISVLSELICLKD